MDFETIIDRLSKQPQSNRLAIYLGIYLLFVVLYIFMGLFPIQERIVMLEGQRDEKQQELALVRSRVSSLESLTAEASGVKGGPRAGQARTAKQL